MGDYSAYTSAELAAIYDVVYDGRGDIAFWLGIAAEIASGSILELGCGTGHVLLPLAEAGHEVTGLDASPQMLDCCRSKLRRLPAEVSNRVRLIEADMTSYEVDGSFGAIFCAFNSFHHLRKVEEQLACLAHSRAHLSPLGTLVLDLFNPDPAPVGGDAGSPPADEAPADLIGWTHGRRLRKWMSRCEYDRMLQCNECEVTYEIIEADGSARRVSETFPLRLVYRYEMEHLLARSGFRIVRLYGDYDRSPFREDSVGMIVVARPEG